MKKKLFISLFFVFSLIFVAKTNAMVDQYSWTSPSQQNLPFGTTQILYNTTTTYSVECDNTHFVDAFGNDLGTSTSASNPVLGVQINFVVDGIKTMTMLSTSTDPNGVFRGTFNSSVAITSSSVSWLHLTTNSPLAVCYGGNKIKIYDNPNGFGNNLPEMRILYPLNDNSIFIHDFTYFTFYVKNIDVNSHNFNFKIVYDTTSTYNNLPKTISRNLNYSFPAGIEHYLNIPKSDFLATSTTYYAKLCVFVDNGAIATCGDSISFKTGNYPYSFQINSEQAGWFGSTTTESGILNYAGLNTSSTDLSFGTGLICDTEFYNPANWACWASQRMILIWNGIKDFAVNEFEQGTDLLFSVWPINAISQFNADLSSVQATTTATTLTFTGQGNAWKKPGGGYYSFTYLTSSTLTSQSISKTNFDWETLVVYFIYAMTGLLVLSVSFVVLHKSSDNNKK